MKTQACVGTDTPPPPPTLASVLLPVGQDYVDALQSIDPSVGGIASISDLDDGNTNNSRSLYPGHFSASGALWNSF